MQPNANGYEYIAASLKHKKNETLTEKYVFNDSIILMKLEKSLIVI